MRSRTSAFFNIALVLVLVLALVLEKPLAGAAATDSVSSLAQPSHVTTGALWTVMEPKQWSYSGTKAMELL